MTPFPVPLAAMYKTSGERQPVIVLAVDKPTTGFRPCYLIALRDGNTLMVSADTIRLEVDLTDGALGIVPYMSAADVKRAA